MNGELYEKPVVYEKETTEKPLKKPKIKIPNGFRLFKIPENLDDIRIGKLRTIHADIFGKEPPHTSGYDKQWIANKIRAILKD